MVPPWSLLLLVASAAAVQCPDGRTCGKKTLCCELPDGTGYGCCPENEVVSRSLPMITPDVSCSGVGCPEEYSCVDTPRGGSACCPLTRGTSCQDGHHCCPSGTLCSEDSHQCVPASNLSAVICPDGRSQCPTDATCCQMADQSWGCCPMPQAICCNDHLHCCPHAYVCDLSHGRCVSQDGVVPLVKKVPAMVKLFSPENTLEVKCADGSSCPDGTTCCQTTDKQYGCCPFLSAVCCNDLIHCCPAGTTCDVPHKKCLSANFEIPMSKKIPILIEKGGDVPCDQQSACPDKTTCCRLASGEWGCCPLEQAVCCDDHEHCCPHGYTCSGGQCQSEEQSIPWSKKIPALKQNSGNVPCDQQSACPDKTTCCRLASGEWGCCPLEQAVCCDDHEHCCPHGYTCSGGQCQSGEQSIPWFNKTPAIKQKSGNVPCDQQSACPDKTTCCRLASGEWGCCPLEQAVCCDDHEHCCPHGYTCSGGQCQSKEQSIPWSKKIPALKQNSGNVPCDQQSACPDKTTCCRLGSGEWGCCPLEQAVCCDDHEHCCPHGYTCSGGQCQSGEQSIPWFNKTPAIKQNSGNVPCDQQSACPDKTTCCRLASGEWGCCPLEQAVCCDDHEHCCPHGYTCSGGQCQSGEQSIPWFKKTPAIKQNSGDVPCDQQSACPDKTTCCRLASGEWGCCPLEQAVCCDDHEHCCPHGYTCAGGQCQSGEESIPWSKKIPAVKQESGNVQCDQQSACPDKTTCCRLASGEWGCCPLEQAVCCDDHEHCCPHGYTCAGGQCQSGEQSIPWFKKTPAIKQNSGDIQCDGQTSCPDQTTCCRLASGEWGCCPYEKAVCCSDHLHCCPYGYTCDVSAGTCNKPASALEKATPVQPLGYVWCDSTHACYDGQTCCVGFGGSWSCCPYPHGVCCPDRIHCCPYGHVCLGSGAACSRESPRWDTVWEEQKRRL